MNTISVALAAYLATAGRDRAYCLKLTRVFDGLVAAGTSWDEPITFGGDVYYPKSGGMVSDTSSTASLAVDETELRANFDVITAADLKAGVWDYAEYEFFLVNPNDLTMGRYLIKTGNIGTVTVDRITFTAELHGLMRALQQAHGRTCTPTCPWILGSPFVEGVGGCGVDLGDAGDSPAGFTRAGTLDSISTDQMTLFDAARTEPGPSGDVAIVSITQANPPVVTLAAPVSQTNGSAIVFHAVVGMVRLNGTWTIDGKSGNTFTINTDTSSDPAFVSGSVTPLGSDAGYFGYGIMTITSGDNAGISREVKTYVVGQWTLQEPFPYALAGTETYEIVAGCDKTETTCRITFQNLDNFGGFFLVPGQDSIMQVGRQE